MCWFNSVLTELPVLVVGGAWVFSRLYCNIFVTLDVMMCTASILNLCAISIDSSGSRKQRRKRRGRPHGERSSLELKRVKEKAPSRKEMEALQADLEQLKALERAPPTPPQAAVWELEGDDAMFQAHSYPQGLTPNSLFRWLSLEYTG
ncbi:unnamed protein product [Boreogadus saida]